MSATGKQPVFHVSLFDDVRDATPKALTLPWGGLAARLTRHTEREAKDGPLFSPTVYADGAKRGNAGVQAVTLAVGDFDHDADWETIAHRLAAWAYAAHSTHSFTPEDQRFRVVIPLTVPVRAKDWPSVWPRIAAHVFGGLCDTSASDAARMYYWPSCRPGAERFATQHDGALLDPLALPPVTARRNGHATAPAEDEAIAAGGRNTSLTRVAGGLRRAGLSEAAITAALLQTNTEKCRPPLEASEVRSIAASMVKYPPAATADGDGGDDSGDGRDHGRRRPSQSSLLILIGGAADLTHDERGDTYATVRVGEHRETFPTRSKAFRRWLTRTYYEAEGGAVSSEALASALGVLEARAQFDGVCTAVHLRCAPDGAGGAFIDLGDESWRAVHVTPRGWEIVEDVPVRFRRPAGMQAFPEPHAGGSLDDLRRFVNVPDAASWALLKAWLVAALRPRGPYPVLVLRGEQGSAKSTLARMLRLLIDPASPTLRADPHDLRDVMIAARACWVAAFDNVSHVQPWLSDCLCRLSTGGGWSTRELYSDADEVLFDVQRPALLNGISEFVARGDLLDRAIQLELPAISEEKRRPEAALWREFEAARPRIFGALLTTLSGALREIENVHLDRLPRMADFALLAVAAERATGGKAAFLEAYATARDDSHRQALDGALIGPTLLKVLADGTFEGTVGELLTRLNALADESLTRAKHWPKTPRGLASEITRLAPALRGLGYSVAASRTMHARTLIIAPEKAAAQPSCPSYRHGSPGNMQSDTEQYTAMLLPDDDSMTVDDGCHCPDRHQPSCENAEMAELECTSLYSSDNDDGHDGHDGLAATPAGDTVARVPLLITADVRRRLRAVGYADGQIAEMDAETAWRCLRREEARRGITAVDAGDERTTIEL